MIGPVKWMIVLLLGNIALGGYALEAILADKRRKAIWFTMTSLILGCAAIIVQTVVSDGH